MIALALTLAFLAGWLTCALLTSGKVADAWSAGRQYGRDEQWGDEVIAAGKKERARHDRAGKFKRLSGGAQPSNQPNGARGLTVVD